MSQGRKESETESLKRRGTLSDEEIYQQHAALVQANIAATERQRQIDAAEHASAARKEVVLWE